MKVYDEDALKEAALRLSERPHTVGELAAMFDKSTKTIRRWLFELKARGFSVMRDGPGVDDPYVIVKR